MVYSIVDSQVIVVFEKEHFPINLDNMSVVHIFIEKELHYLELIKRSINALGCFQNCLFKVWSWLATSFCTGNSVV
jgi:hypothetical protein